MASNSGWPKLDDRPLSVQTLQTPHFKAFFMRASHNYFSTSQTAQMLGLSVGTIQRMVAAGVLQAYTTQGGHRRILASSVRQYCQLKGVPATEPQPTSTGLCIVHDASIPATVQQALGQLAHVLLVSHPLELAGLREDCAAFFLDAHVAWLDWADLQRPLSLASDARFIVYNSADLTPSQHQAVAPHAQLYPGNISADLVTGFLLGLGALSSADQEDLSQHH
jgi:excisionase family DNA binding protein